MKKYILLAGCFFALSALAIKDTTVVQKQAQLSFNAWKKCKEKQGNNCEKLLTQFATAQATLLNLKNERAQQRNHHLDKVAYLITN